MSRMNINLINNYYIKNINNRMFHIRLPHNPDSVRTKSARQNLIRSNILLLNKKRRIF